MSLFVVLFRPIAWQAARSVLLRPHPNDLMEAHGHWTAAALKDLMDDAWQRFATLEPDLSAEKTVGSRVSVRLATFDICLYQALVGKGTARQVAMQIVQEINWAVYKRVAKLPMWLAGIVTRNPVRRMQMISTLIMTKFPFNPPGFQVEMLPSTRGGRFNVLRCPVAEQMKMLLPAQDAQDLCVATWCALDRPSAELWGGHLERTGTIAGGATCCDFHFVGDV